jgi:long-chain acyl-CoA synthetase
MRPPAPQPVPPAPDHYLLSAMRLYDHAQTNPDRPVAIEATTGRVRTFAELDERSRRLAAALEAAGVEEQGHVAVLLPNVVEYFDVVWAAQRSGLWVTPVNWHLSGSEAAYIISDCDAQALVTSDELLGKLPEDQTQLADPRLILRAGEELDSVIAAAPPQLGRTETEGALMFYSSGTTGRPKGILRPWSSDPYGTMRGLDLLMKMAYGFDTDTVYLCPAPLYHAAPLAWSMGAQRMGGTVVVMEKFDPLETLRLIEQYKVTHMQMVPTMFVRLLKLPDEDRHRYDLSSLKTVIHAAAPCPVDVKHKMMAWWGPIIHEYYSSSEGAGFTLIGPEEWLAHPGSVGRSAGGAIHILGDDGEELPAGEIGTIWFEGTPRFVYHKDAQKTAEAFNDRGWSSLGDMGHVDEEGYLYMSDRRTNLILSGGVNIYPQEIENALTLHPEVLDVAVIGVPDPEMGQQVKAVVHAADPSKAGPELEAELIAFCRTNLSSYKCPKTVDFVDELPRMPSGKLAKRLLVDQYRQP